MSYIDDSLSCHDQAAESEDNAYSLDSRETGQGGWREGSGLNRSGTCHGSQISDTDAAMALVRQMGQAILERPNESIKCQANQSLSSALALLNLQ